MRAPSPKDRFEVLGVSVDALTADETVDRIRSLVDAAASGYVVFCTVSSVLAALDDLRVAKAMAAADIVTPDGMPLVWLGRRSVEKRVERVYGPDFMLQVLEATGSEFSHYFFGGRDGVVDEMVGKLRSRYPSMRVAGSHEPSGELDLEETDGDVERIRSSGADLVWVGLGHPKQEQWMHRHMTGDIGCIALGVGAAFDFHAGRKREAPRWMKKGGLQWLHRLITEPRRLWRRYLIGNVRFIWLLARQGSARRS